MHEQKPLKTHPNCYFLKGSKFCFPRGEKEVNFKKFPPPPPPKKKIIMLLIDIDTFIHGLLYTMIHQNNALKAEFERT